MALFKNIKQDDGVTTSYHRILCVTKTVNRQNSISIISYVDDEARENDKEPNLAQPYTKCVTYETTYDDTMTVADAYEWLKTLSIFEGSEDV